MFARGQLWTEEFGNESLWIMLKTGRQLLFESHCMFYEKVIKRSSFFEN